MAANIVEIDIHLVEKAATASLNKLGGDIKKFEGKATAAFKGVSHAWDFFKAQIAANVVSRAFNTIVNAVSGAGRSFMDFSSAVAEVNSILPATAKLTEQNKNQLVDFSSKFGGTPAQQAKAFYQIVSAGIEDTSEAMKLLEIANKAATAGITDTTTAVDVITSVMANYADQGIDATTASDMLFTAVKQGKTTFGELAGQVGAIAPTFKAAGLSFDQLTGSLAFTTKVGLSTDRAATGLGAVVRALIKPTAEAEKAAKRLGIQFNVNALQSKGLAGVLDDVIKKTGGNVTEIGKLFTETTALNTVSAIAKGNFDDFRRILSETKNSAGATGAAFKVVNESMAKQYELLGQKLENFALEFLRNFEKPITNALITINKFIDDLKNMGKWILEAKLWFERNEEAIKAYGVAIGIVMASFASYIAITKVAAAVFTVYKAGILGLTIAINGLNVAQAIYNGLSKLTPWGLAAVGIAAVVFGIKELIVNYDRSIAILKNFGASIIDGVLVPLRWLLKAQQAYNELIGNETPSGLQNTIEALDAYAEKMHETAETEFYLAEKANEQKEESFGKDQARRLKEEEQRIKALEGATNTSKTLTDLEKKRLADSLKNKKDNDKAITENTKNQLSIEQELLKAANDMLLDDVTKKYLIVENAKNKEVQFLIENLGQRETANLLHQAKVLDMDGKHEEARKKLHDAYNKVYEDGKKKKEGEEIAYQKRLADHNYFGGSVIMAMEDAFNNKYVKAALKTNDQLLKIQNSKYRGLAAIGKAAALVRITVDTAQGAVGAYSSLATIPIVGPMLGAAAAAALVAYGAEQYANVLGSFQFGGVIPGQSISGDNVMARVNSGEMILNRAQQANLLNMATHGGEGVSSSDISMLADAIREQPIVVEIDGTEVARAVRNAQLSGFSLQGA